MRNFKFVCLMAMAGLLLFLGGCQKEEIFPERMSNKKVPFVYKPYFNALSSESNFGNDNVIEAPDILELQIMTETMKLIEMDSKYASGLVKARRKGFNPLINYSIKLSLGPEGNYVIMVPLANDSITGFISLYVRTGNQYEFYLLERNVFLPYCHQNETNIEELARVFLPLNYFNAFDFHIFHNYNATINDWVIQNARKLVSSGPRCTVITTYWWGYGLNGGVPFQAMSGIANVIIDCSNQGDGWDSKNAGSLPVDFWLASNSGGNNTGNTPIIELILEEFPFVDPACLQLLTSDMKEQILNMHSPCNQELLKQKITNAINKACNNAKTAGGDNFTMNIEMWEFSKAVRDDLEVEEYVVLNRLPIDLMDCGKTKDQNLAYFDEYMGLNGGCLPGRFRQVLNSFLGFNYEININNPVLSSSKKICPDFFVVTPSNLHNERNVAGISGLQFQFDIPGGEKLNISFDKLFFQLDNSLNCPLSTAEIIALAINNAIRDGQENLSNGRSLIPSRPELTPNQALLINIDNAIGSIARDYGCKGRDLAGYPSSNTSSIFYHNVLPANYENAASNNNHCGATFVPFNQQNFNRCE